MTTAQGPQPVLGPTEAAPMVELRRRYEELRAECALLRAVARAVEEFLAARPGGTARAMEATITVWKTWRRETRRDRGRG
jgi:hypothetical protein